MDLGHARFGGDGRGSPSERKVGAGTMKTKSVINHLRSIGRDDKADELSDTLLRRYADSKRAQGMKEEDIARRLRAIGVVLDERDDQRSSCVDFTDALMSFTSPTRRPPVPPLHLAPTPSPKVPPKPLEPKRQVLYPSPTSPLHAPIHTPRKVLPSTISSPPSPALSNLVTPPTPRTNLPIPVVIPPTPPTPTRPRRRRRLKASISSIETITNVPRPRDLIPALTLPRLPSLVNGDEFNLDLFSPRPLTLGHSETFFSSTPLAVPQASSSRAGSRTLSMLSDPNTEDWDEGHGQLLDAFPLPPPRASGGEVLTFCDEAQSTGPSRALHPSASELPSPDRPWNPSSETPETIRPTLREHKPTRSMTLEDMWWDEESDAQTVTAATLRTQRSSLQSQDSEWSARCEGQFGSTASTLTCPSAASLIRDEYLKARLKDSRCSIDSFSQGDPFIRATLSAMAAHGRA